MLWFWLSKWKQEYTHTGSQFLTHGTTWLNRCNFMLALVGPAHVHVVIVEWVMVSHPSKHQYQNDMQQTNQLMKYIKNEALSRIPSAHCIDY